MTDGAPRLCLCRDCQILITDGGPLCAGCVAAGCVELVWPCRRPSADESPAD